MRKHIIKKSLIVCIILLFTFSSFASSISGFVKETQDVDFDFENSYEPEEKVVVSCHSYGAPGKPLRQAEMSKTEAYNLLDKINAFAEIIASNSFSNGAEKMQEEIILVARDYGLLPTDISFTDFQPRIFSSLERIRPKKGTTPVNGNRGTASFCNFATTGSGMQFPIIILPRMIPILLTPIPRAFLHWSANEGLTTCGSYLTGTGFIAGGMQRGTALGFWGIGFSVFLPPVMAYGFIGYALFATCTAEEMEPWPPNYAPEVSAVSPIDGAENVAVSTSELSFQISDENGDKMDYTVTTNPDIGSGSGHNQPGGTYSIPISGLEGTEEYTWKVEVTDGQKTVEATFSFETEQVAPVISNPVPIDGSRHTSIDLSQLSFYVSDPQGDLMDFTVETVPDIGSGSDSGVSEGTYNIDVSDLDNDLEYIWYVNATDGTYWKHEVFHFKTRPSPGPWWDENWSYRKYLGIMDVSSDYQLKIQVWREDGHDTPLSGSIDCENNCKEDFSDIRFVTFSGVECNYWIEENSSNEGDHYAIFWVKTPLSGDEQLYLYYGNYEAQDESCGDDTFIFFDDFENNNLNKWINQDNAWEIQSSIVKSGTYAAHGYDSSSGSCGQLKNNAHNSSSYVLEEWVRFGETNRYHYPAIPRASTNSEKPSLYLLSARDNGHWGYYDGNWPYKNFPNDKTYTSNIWYHVELKFDAAQQKYWVKVDNFDLTGPSGLPLICADGSTLPTDGQLNLKIYVGSHKQTDADFWLDNYLVRKYAIIPPIWEAFGFEETGP
jgi:hypothetical protein